MYYMDKCTIMYYMDKCTIMYYMVKCTIMYYMVKCTCLQLWCITLQKLNYKPAERTVEVKFSQPAEAAAFLKKNTRLIFTPFIDLFI